MLFKIFASALVFSATAYSAAVPAQITPDQIKVALDGLRSKATAVKTPIDRIADGSATQFLTGGGPYPAVIAGLQDIAVNSQGLAVLLQNAPNIPSGSGANAVIAAYQAFAQAQQAALNTLNERVNTFPPNPTVAAPLSGVLQNLQVGVTNLFNTLTARLTTQDAPQVQQPQNALQDLLNQLTSTLSNLLGGLNLQTLLGNLLGGVTGGATGGATNGLTNVLPALPVNLPIVGGGSSSCGAATSALNLGTLPILTQVLSTVTGATGGVTGGNPTNVVSNLLNGVLGGNGKGLLGGVLAKRAEVY